MAKGPLRAVVASKGTPVGTEKETAASVVGARVAVAPGAAALAHKKPAARLAGVAHREPAAPIAGGGSSRL